MRLLGAVPPLLAHWWPLPRLLIPGSRRGGPKRRGIHGNRARGRGDSDKTGEVNQSSRPRFLVGAYAAQPADPTAYYALLAEQPWIDGLEIPYPGVLAADAPTLARSLPPGWANSVTLIPGTMGRLGADPTFGLASPDAEGRAAALSHAGAVRDAVAELVAAGALVRHVQVHSAPTRIADADAFTRSLATLQGLDWSGADLVIEHCDAWVPGQPPEKGFLSLTAEIDVARRLGVGIHINWGRSALEARDADAPREHIVAAREAGVLSGVIFSGAGDRPTTFGGAWADVHLPASPDEPLSLMTPARIAECAQAAGDVAYLGAKLQMPKDVSTARRLAMLTTIADAAGVIG